MRKFILLISALVLSLTINAAVINITPTSPHSSNNLRQAIAAASTGDIIEMAAGTYPESGNYIAFTGKEVTVRAAEGAEVIIQTVCPVRLEEGAKAEFINVKFDCSQIDDDYNNVIVAADDTENKRVVLKGCEFYGLTKGKAMIEATSSRRLYAITIDNCYFHDCMKSVVFVENTGYNDLSITNSTFANIDASAASAVAGIIDSRATSGSFLVDHCTFYNVEAKNTDYAAIGKVKLTSGAVVSNCIFALSASGAATNRTIRDKVAANNCLVYNYTTDSNYGMQSNVTKTGCFIADPLFDDLANDKYTFDNNWITMSISPAVGAATDGSDLGDPRWYTDPVLPSTDFASPYVLTGEKAKLTGKVATDASNYLQFSNTSDATQHGVAIWKVHATRSCILQATLNIDADNTSGHRYQIEVFDSSNTLVGSAIGESANSYEKGDKVISDLIMLSEAGDYKIKLSNLCDDSRNLLHSITLSYAGGAVIEIPGQLLGEDALLYKTGSKYMIRTEEGYLKSSNNVDPTSEWAAWNIAATAGTMNVTLNLDPATSSGHNYRVELYDGAVLKDYAEELVSDESSAAVHTTGDILLEKTLVIPADGDYTIKLINRTQWSSMILHSITFTPIVAPTLVTMNDTDEDNTAWAANVGGAAVNVELTRSFTGGMYNTISFPFAVSSEKVIAAFGAGVELMYMTGATLDGTVLDLEFAPTTSIYQGTPYLIKPTADVVNPQFTSVEFVLSDATSSATSGTNADFIGTFIKQTIPGNPNNLYLQANNMLQFSQSDVTIKGTRAYFRVNAPSSALPVLRPRIVMNGQVLTDMELVNGEPQTDGKFIENGQLIIVRDGVRYNALGIRVE